MKTRTQPKAVFRRNTRTVADAQKSIREDDRIDGTAKELILNFLSYLALDNLKPTTVISYAITLRRLAEMCPPKGFLYLERSDIREVLLALQQRGFAVTTLHLFKARFMRFQRWLREEHGYPQDYPAPLLAGKKLDPGEKPVEFRGIKSSNKYRLRYGPEDLPTQKDVDNMVDVGDGLAKGYHDEGLKGK